MKFKYKIQPYQTEAVESVVRVFDGQPNLGAGLYICDLGEQKPTVPDPQKSLSLNRKAVNDLALVLYIISQEVDTHADF